MVARAFTSASGLRPISAFVVIGIVVFAVAAKVVRLSYARGSTQPARVSVERGLPPAYRITDTEGRVLSHFVPRFDLIMSPRSMWQAHTPVHMAKRISETLGGEPSALDLLDCMLPDAEEGVIEVKAWDLSARQANRLQEWVNSGAGTATSPLGGIWINRIEGPGTPHYRLFWQPEELLSKAQREAHGYSSPWAWARRIGSGLERCLRTPGVPDPNTSSEWDERRARIWADLIPRAWCCAVKGISSEVALELRDLLRREGVSPWQMNLDYARDREYPCGTHELFGSWGFVDESQTEARPREGLELYCDRLLQRDQFAFLEREPSVYAWRRDRAVRGERANGFLGHAPRSENPTVTSTLDLSLQRFVHRTLQATKEEHLPALAMAIVIEVETGNVLAVDSVEEYEIAPFAPIYHAFTPGSTMKVLTMANALEEGVVTPTEEFDVGHGAYRVVGPDGGRARVIHEAEGSLGGVHSAEQLFARSVNAGLVQIGLRVPADIFRDYLVELGYGAAPGSGLGIEKAGHLRELPWKYRYTHASVTFGHEMTTTLWQHAAALATVVRGGDWRPLRIVDAVVQNGDRHELPVSEGKPVYSPETCRQVRAMMELGARAGTGKSIARPDIEMGTKTGTAQKVPTELCIHIELAARERWDRDGTGWTKARYRALKSEPKPHPECYTSSMCVFGRLPGTERELLVLVVVDEPRGKQKYGSKVAGPAAAAILAEALGVTRNGEEPVEPILDEFNLSTSAIRGEAEMPWQTAAPRGEGGF